MLYSVSTSSLFRGEVTLACTVAVRLSVHIFIFKVSERASFGSLWLKHGAFKTRTVDRPVDYRPELIEAY